ncbi:MAG: zinc ABC transporter substrate-binding protein [Candidatus Eremiobacteraeota bacterium]|nr:zinc ABC transporter substrate-binding protein [Candidatus Eremiobacteraeota bacterium]MBC5827031.1 zinc ABC transporter substrate-binding protein [Candidatus Eremiobacteraeota bacterium]
MILDNRTAALACAAFIACASTSACGSRARQPATATATDKVQVVASMSTLAALVRTVAGGKADVRSLVPVGGSVETYDPTPADLVVLSRARLLVENGAGLELWLAKLVRAGGRADLRTLVLSDGLPVARSEDAGDFRRSAAGNPHLWLDPVYAQTYVKKITDGLASVDPSNADYYRSNERRQVRRLQALDVWARGQVDTIPSPDRVMICFHDAWYYFDRRYGIRDVGAVEPAPGQEPSAGYFAELVAAARANHVRAVFAEPQFSPKLADELAASAGIRTVSDLYDDTVGATQQLSTYEAMMRYDVRTIVSALRP